MICERIHVKKKKYYISTERSIPLSVAEWKQI